MNDSVLLREATVQEIQLELIRRTKFNAFNGEQIHASLMKHRALWQAVLLDSPGLANYRKPRHLLTSGLIKLRDLDDNIWNADKLFILTAKREQAIQLRASLRKKTGAAKNRLCTTIKKRWTLPSAWVARNTDFYRSGGIELINPEFWV